MIQDKIFFDEKDPTGLSYNTPFTYYGSYQGRLWSKSPSGSIQYYTQNSDLSAYATTGSNQFSGSQTVTGSLTVTGGVTGTTTTASYVEYANVANRPALISGSAQIAAFGYATTGSNGFNGSQSITGSLTVTGQVVAQTLNVQQVTSSIVYSSGSNIFGNSLANTQQFTGSVGVTGSLTINGTSAVVGSGTTNYVPKFTACNTIGNSIIQEVSSNIGIGVSPSRKLHVLGGAGTAQIQSSGASSIMYFGDACSSVIDNQGFGSIGNSLFLLAGGSERLFLNCSGNLGLGVTPSAWDGSLIRAIQITDNGGSISSFSTGNTSNKFTFVTNNAFYDSAGWKYATNGAVAQYRLVNENHQWHTAPSGTAGNAISFTQAMTLNASGRLLLGTTDDNGARLQVSGGNITATNNLVFNRPSTSAGNNIEWRTASTLNWYIGTRGLVDNNFYFVNEALGVNNLILNASTGAATFSSSVTAGSFLATDATGSVILTTNGGGEGVLSVNTANPLRFLINGTERMRITSSGNVGIGIDIPTGNANRILHINGADSAEIHLTRSNSGTSSTFGGYVNFDGSNNFNLQNRTGGAINLITGTTNALTIASTGTACFACQVCAPVAIFSGCVGIGNTIPVASLDTVSAVTGTYAAGTQQVVARFYNSPASLGSGNNSAFLSLQTTPDGGNANPVARIGVVGESYGTNLGAFVVATRDAGGVTERMRITSSGYVAVTGNQALSCVPYLQGMSFGWNRTNGQGESMINWTNAGGGTSCDLTFNFRDSSTLYERVRITSTGNILPGANGTQDLGSSSLRWCTVYTSDLSLNNGIGNYTIVEGQNDLFIYNNNSCKVYKFLLQEVCPEMAPAKRST